jgi:hypothetical protein
LVPRCLVRQWKEWKKGSRESQPASSEGKPAKTVLFQAKIGRVIAFIVRTIAPGHPNGSEKLRQAGHNLPQAATSTGRGLISPLMKRQVEHFVRAGFV